MRPPQELALKPQAVDDASIPSDQSLVCEVREGSQDAATALFRRYQSRLAALVKSSCSAPLGRRIDPEDILQSVFRRFFHHVREGDYAVPTHEDLWSLLLTITLNRLRSEETRYRASKRDFRREKSGLAPVVLSEDDHPWEWLIVEETLANLPERYREVVVLRLQGHEVEEIAQRTRRSLRTVERLLQETRKRLGGLLDEPNE